MRYDLRRDFRGWTVFDRWTDQVVVLGGVEQAGLTRGQADALLWDLRRAPGEVAGGAILQHARIQPSTAWGGGLHGPAGPHA